MRILLDIGHPAHVHYFRNAVRELKNRGHIFHITTRDKEVTLELLKSYGFDYVCTGKNKKGTVKKFLSMIRNDRIILREALKFKPDLFLSFFSPFAAHVGKLLNIPVIGFTDSEFAKFSIKLTNPFTDYKFTPECFWDDLGKNHFRFKGYMESFYLHPKYFTPDPEVFSRLGLKDGETYFIVRFVSFNANHDIGETGMDDAAKYHVIEMLEKKGKVFISSEGEIENKLASRLLKTDPQDFHNVLAFASMYVGEGITTASECAQLGTPAILINSIKTSYIQEQQKKELVFSFDKAEDSYATIDYLLKMENLKSTFINRRDLMLSEMIDCTNYLVELIDNFPESIPGVNLNQQTKEETIL